MDSLSSSAIFSTQSLSDLIDSDDSNNIITNYYNTNNNNNSPFLQSIYLLSSSVLHGDENYVHNLTRNDTYLPLKEHNSYILPWWQQLIFSFIFGGMILVATGGNLIVIWLVLAHKRMRTVTNYFIVNLSVADIMVSTLNVIFNFVCMLIGNWPFGGLYCKISNFIAILSVTASVLTLMAISIDRYVAIIYPLRPRMTRTTTLWITIFIWITSSIVSLPNIIYSGLKKEEFMDGDISFMCLLVWPDGVPPDSQMDLIYNVLLIVVTYMIPMCSMCFTYFRVGRELWGSKGIGEYTTHQMESIKSKRKIVKMMIVVFVIFAVCWLPYHIFFLVTHWFPEIIRSQHAYLIIYWLAMSNSMYNPIIYCWMNSRFRYGFKKVFCCICDGSEEHDDSRCRSRPRTSISEACVTENIRLNGNGNFNMNTMGGNADESLSLKSTSDLKNDHLRVHDKKRIFRKIL